MVAKYEKAIENSIRAFYKGQLPEKAIEASEEEFVYDLDYFDAMAKEREKPKKKAKKLDEPTPEPMEEDIDDGASEA